jgi:lipopolysaccharide transport system ATP-binding protein
MSLAIKVENLSKAYRLGLIGTGTLGSDLKRWYALARGREDPFLKIGETNDRTVKSESNVVWSLKDICFEIEQGDAVGIIGKNGAGKSTLLKILSRVTSPTTGKIIGNGRVASLLEVGTGFHPELTGKDNIYLNGAILGMRKKEITRKLDEIIAFAGVERYVDTPVKRYSSGMYVRLAFAVAAHLESEILIVDEVLAVGDAEFQKKCLGKMGEVSKGEGRTVLFVSHNMAAVKSLCAKAILLEKGIQKFVGSSEKAVALYLNENANSVNTRLFGDDYHFPEFNLHEIMVKAKHTEDEYLLIEDDEIELITDITLKATSDHYHITYHLYNEMGEPMFSFSHRGIGLEKGRNRLTCIFPKSFFNPGSYYLTFFMIKNRAEAVFIEKDIISFSVVDASRELGVYMGKEPGYIKPSFIWEISYLND